MPPQLFDTKATFTAKIPLHGEIKKIAVRYPTDAEWMERNKRRKVVTLQLGRGNSKTVFPGPGESDVTLVNAILEDKSLELDPASAYSILEQLSQVEVSETSREAGGFRVETAVFGAAPTEQHLAVPSARDLTDFEEMNERVSCPNGRMETTVNLTVPESIYNRLSRGAAGYANGVPIFHKLVVVKTVIDAIQRELQDGEEENF
jgi:hypothetical protein